MTLSMPHMGNGPALEIKPTPILVIGPAANALANALVRMKSNTEIHSADTAKEALDLLKTKEFDHVLIDNRNDGTLSLTIPALSRVETIGKLTVLAGPQSYDAISAIPGVGSVIKEPYNPVEIASSLNIEIIDSRKTSDTENNQGRRKNDLDVVTQDNERAPVQENHGEVVEDASAEQEIEEKRPHAIRFLSALVNFIPSLTPIISMLYKNTALTILAALFVAFVSYGVMIAYFLSSDGWSTPLQLQRGHELVLKAERQRGELSVKRNLVTRQILDADSKVERGQTNIQRAEVLAQITKGTIEQEATNLKDRLPLLSNEISLLKNILNSYGSANDRRKQVTKLKRDYNNRVITRTLYQDSLLASSKIEENIINIKEKISAKKTDLKLGDQSLNYLNKLKEHLSGDSSDPSQLLGGNAVYVPIANQVIKVKQIRANGKADIQEFESTRATLENSLEVLTNSINELEKTPMIRALDAPINVLFVPYDNLDAYVQGEHLYTCTIAIIWCSNVGTVGAPIGGEITTTHPFFGKPIRGLFVEAQLTEKSAAKKEIIHVGRPPLLF